MAKINRTKLLKLIDERMTEIHSQAVRDRETALRKAASAAEAYVSTTRSAWLVFVQNVTRALDNGEPITGEYVPRELLDSGWARRDVVLRVYTPDATPRPVPRVPDNPEYRNLLTLRRALETIVDDEVSTYSLEKMGFQLGKVLRGVS